MLESAALLKRWWKPLAIAAASFAASVLVFSLWFYSYANSLIKLSDSSIESASYEINRGQSLSRVATELADQGVIDHPQAFVLLARLQGVAGSLRRGEYELTPQLSHQQLLERFVSGATRQYRLTLVEGWRFSEALQAIQTAEAVTVTLGGLSPAEIARRLGMAETNPEGLLFPETYFYEAGTSDLELLQRAAAQLNETLEREWQGRLGALPFSSAYEALILASIIEKESAQNSERGHIAGVFIRRLENGMRLQSDPTVIYGLGDAYDGNITRADLRQTTPYNTYRINGLPPTPIALPGLDSIRASLNPLSSDYLYFVARGDGSHQFSATLAEHNAAVDRFQRGVNTAEQ